MWPSARPFLLWCDLIYTLTLQQRRSAGRRFRRGLSQSQDKRRLRLNAVHQQIHTHSRPGRPLWEEGKMGPLGESFF